MEQEKISQCTFAPKINHHKTFSKSGYKSEFVNEGIENYL